MKTKILLLTCIIFTLATCAAFATEPPAEDGACDTSVFTGKWQNVDDENFTMDIKIDGEIATLLMTITIEGMEPQQGEMTGKVVDGEIHVKTDKPGETGILRYDKEKNQLVALTAKEDKEIKEETRFKRPE